MESVNVLVASSVDDKFLQQIAGVSSRIKLTDVSDLFRAERSGDPTAKEKLDALLAETEVIFGLLFPQNYIARAPKLKWVQAMSAGLNHILDAEMVKSPVILTNVSGIHAVAISEFVLGLMLMFVKQIPRCFQVKQEKKWRHFYTSELRSKTVGIVGLGSIGREVAHLAKALGMRVLAVDVKTLKRARYVDIMLPLDQLRQLLGESDFVALTVPLTPETTKLIGEEELRAMKPTAYLINTSRGGIVDEEALIRALDEHWIAGAGLDVVTTEPLSPDNRLWELPNVILSPHISGHLEEVNMWATELFADNLRRYLNGKKLHNVVNKKKGY